MLSSLFLKLFWLSWAFFQKQQKVLILFILLGTDEAWAEENL